VTSRGVNLAYKQVVGGDPLLKLIAVDWFKVDERFDSVALHPKSLVQVSKFDKYYQYSAVMAISCCFWNSLNVRISFVIALIFQILPGQ